MKYRVKFLKRARNDLTALPGKDRKRIVQRIEALSDNPKPAGSAPLKGDLKGHYRIKSGDYRIIYCIKKNEIIVVVVRIGHRRGIYRK